MKGKDETANDRYYSVYIWNTEKKARIAMAVDNGTVIYHGHSNYGLGYSFTTNNTNIAAFVNIAEDLVPINWPYLRDHQDHPNLMIQTNEYGDDTTTQEQYDPVGKSYTIEGYLNDHDTTRYFSQPVSGGWQCHLHTGTNQWHDYHQPPSPANPDDDAIRLVVKAGSSDMPAKNWKRIYLVSCYSGPYYYYTFNHGALFYTYEECLQWSDCPREFIKAIIDGKGNADILDAINASENVNDFHEF